MIQPAPSRAGSLPLIGSEIAFDFTNTASGRGHESQQDHLRCGADVVVWARHARVLAPGDGDVAKQMLAADTALADRLLARALELRETIHRTGAVIAAGGEPTAEDRDRLTAEHAACLTRARLTPHQGGFVWAWAAADGPAEAILGPVTLSALTLLTQSDLSRIKQCQGEHCGWLFFDVTKNKSRRWCEMEVCGNRAKQKALRARLRPRAEAVE
ncbi:CGNR zinc finger domain-containing protein [Labrys wisconsinensis]|uniref:RNA-binding Zn ribbon-like protein n=1 Tax=Labrys wisconsinensis TaxID=425677 RepID=A0ABU0JBD0_9HYPH|nr:CGNR zinc finger domain-containing protein [Labrys wisconsinensis]MDQ0471573.1 putative RNA-binding Zn ribbon-like protein [Labrys wisconsinensis]